MHFSCKITHAILTELEAEKIDLSIYFSDADIPWEKLRDSSGWMRAPDMEAFLDRVVQDHETLIQAGHNTPKRKVWGLLDSVLRMMPQPQEIFQQPEKLLGYFISPEPPIENILRTDKGIAFDIPLPAEQYPLVTTYLKAAFEALPLYVGMQAGTCRWHFLRFELDWPQPQHRILDHDEPHQISPQLMQDVIRHLQESSQDLEEKNRELERRNEELLKISNGIVLPVVEINSEDFNQFKNSKSDAIEFDFMKRPVHQVAQNLSKLHDYMVRAHQLVTLLTAGQKQTPGIKQAFHKVDWDIVKTQYPQIILESLDLLKKVGKSENSADKN